MTTKEKNVNKIHVYHLIGKYGYERTYFTLLDAYVYGIFQKKIIIKERI